MVWYRCLDCEAIVPEESLAERDAELVDSLRPWDKVAVCPCCYSDELEKLDSCPVCKRAVTERGTQFCPRCRKEIDDAFHEAFDRVYRYHPQDWLNVVELMFERAEEVKFYG